jgi:hypothetical protein
MESLKLDYACAFQRKTPENLLAGAKLLLMTRRPRGPDEILTRKERADLQYRLSMMGATAVRDFYRSAHCVCRIGPGHFPSARAIQELVQAWKQMRKWT